MKENAWDPDIKRVLGWFLTFLETGEWRQRREAIEEYLERVLEPRSSREDARILEPVSINDDRMGWYLYLAETALQASYNYEPIQGARVLPIFKRLGVDFTRLLQIRGVEDKAARLLSIERNQPDSGLFELLTALLWLRNGWSDVELLPETPPQKRPDIRATSSTEEWFIECKRLSKSSVYSLREREKWLKMWRYLSDFLIGYRLPYVLDIVFHVELDTLPDEFLRDELIGKLPLISPPCTLISNENWDVSARLVDLQEARAHLRKNYVKNPSTQLYELVVGRVDPNRGVTVLVEGQYVRIGEGRGNNCFLGDMSFAAGAVWDCDAERAIENKARDIRRQLAEAVEQLPENKRCVVHLGLETLDGWLVEAERYSRIVNTILWFDAKGKDLLWIYCHLFQSYAPPNQTWVIDETVYYFSNQNFPSQEPLKLRLSVSSNEDEASASGVHWLRDYP